MCSTHIRLVNNYAHFARIHDANVITTNKKSRNNSGFSSLDYQIICFMNNLISTQNVARAFQKKKKIGFICFGDRAKIIKN